MIRRTMVGLVACLFVACAANDGPKRFRVSGEAKFDGQPIVHGDVLFTPDGAKGNSGPQGIAGGPIVIRVTALTGPGGKLVCEYEMKKDLPRADGTLDIDVPKSAAARPSNKPDI